MITDERYYYNSLTPKQAIYVSELASGLDALEIAARHKKSKYTIRNTITKAKERIGAESTTNLVAHAITKGWIVPSDDNCPPIVYEPSHD